MRTKIYLISFNSKLKKLNPIRLEELIIRLRIRLRAKVSKWKFNQKKEKENQNPKLTFLSSRSEPKTKQKGLKFRLTWLNGDLGFARRRSWLCRENLSGRCRYRPWRSWEVAWIALHHLCQAHLRRRPEPWTETSGRRPRRKRPRWFCTCRRYCDCFLVSWVFLLVECFSFPCGACSGGGSWFL